MGTDTTVATNKEKIRQNQKGAAKSPRKESSNR
jgi:hypothetical protein